MYYRSIILKAISYINDAIIDKQSSVKYYGIPYVDIIGLCYSVTIL